MRVRKRRRNHPPHNPHSSGKNGKNEVRLLLRDNRNRVWVPFRYPWPSPARTAGNPGLDDVYPGPQGVTVGVMKRSESYSFCDSRAGKTTKGCEDRARSPTKEVAQRMPAYITRNREQKQHDPPSPIGCLTMSTGRQDQSHRYQQVFDADLRRTGTLK
jgi:hypothetical protein